MDPTSWTYNTEKTGEVKCWKPRNLYIYVTKLYSVQCTKLYSVRRHKRMIKIFTKPT